MTVHVSFVESMFHLLVQRSPTKKRPERLEFRASGCVVRPTSFLGGACFSLLEKATVGYPKEWVLGGSWGLFMPREFP